MHTIIRCLWKLPTQCNLEMWLPGILSTQSRSCLYMGVIKCLFWLSQHRGDFVCVCFLFLSFSFFPFNVFSTLCSACRSPQHPAWHQSFKTFLKWQNVYAGYVLQFISAVWNRLFFMRLLLFCFLLFQVEMLTSVNSLYLKLFFFTLGNSNMKSCLWFSECLMLVRPLNRMLIINWLSMSSFSYHKVLTMGRESHFFSWAPHGVEAPEKTGPSYSMKCSVRKRNSVGWHLGWGQSSMGRHWKS